MTLPQMPISKHNASKVLSHRRLWNKSSKDCIYARDKDRLKFASMLLCKRHSKYRQILLHHIRIKSRQTFSSNQNTDFIMWNLTAQ